MPPYASHSTCVKNLSEGHERASVKIIDHNLSSPVIKTEAAKMGFKIS